MAERRQGSDSECDYSSNDSSSTSSESSSEEEFSPAHIQPYSFEPRFEVEQLEEDEDEEIIRTQIIPNFPSKKNTKSCHLHFKSYLVSVCSSTK